MNVLCKIPARSIGGRNTSIMLAMMTACMLNLLTGCATGVLTRYRVSKPLRDFDAIEEVIVTESHVIVAGTINTFPTDGVSTQPQQRAGALRITHADMRKIIRLNELTSVAEPSRASGAVVLSDLFYGAKRHTVRKDGARIRLEAYELLEEARPGALQTLIKQDRMSAGARVYRIAEGPVPYPWLKPRYQLDFSQCHTQLERGGPPRTSDVLLYPVAFVTDGASAVAIWAGTSAIMVVALPVIVVGWTILGTMFIGSGGT